VLIAVTLAVAGCSAEAAPPAAKSTVSTTTSRTATTTTTTTAPLVAADGRNLEACADGTCEVLVQTGDQLPNASGEGSIGIAVADGEVTITFGGLSAVAGPGATPNVIQGQAILTVAVQGDQALLRLSMQ